MDFEDVDNAEVFPREKNEGEKMDSKFLKAKSNAEKEIEEWAVEGAAIGLSRHSGQLSDNVTEERMLRSKIMDLSKARYKYKSQSGYEQRLFLEKQKRKSGYFKHLLRNVEVGLVRRKSWPVEGEGSDIVNNSARNALLDRFDPSKSLDRPKEVLKMEKDKEDARLARSQSQLIMPRIKTSSRMSQSSMPLPVFETETKTQNTTLPSVPLERGVTFAAANQESKPSLRKHAKSAGGGRQSALKKLHNGPVYDPRYLELRNALAEPYELKHPADVSTVVQKMNALHTPPRRPKEGKPKLGLKIQEYMRERGIAF